MSRKPTPHRRRGASKERAETASLQRKPDTGDTTLTLLNRNYQTEPLKPVKSNGPMIPTPPVKPKTTNYIRKINEPRAPEEPKFMLNLEDIVILEEKISGMLDMLANPANCTVLCEDWWDISAENTLSKVDRLFRDERLRKSLKLAMIYESIGVAVLYHFSKTSMASANILTQIRSIFTSIHQNFLIIIDYVLQRLPPDCVTNPWANTLITIVGSKRRRTKKLDNLQGLKTNNEVLSNTLQILCKAQFAKTEKSARLMFLPCLQILKNLDKIEMDRVRNLLENAISASQGGNPDVLLVNEMNGPSFFFNPSMGNEECKVEPPFLPAIDNKVYTLVLDLDETLVHYYEDNEQGKYSVRPHCKDFLKEMSEHYEIVIFTAAIQEVFFYIVRRLGLE